MPRKASQPSLCVHKGTGQAYVTLAGKRVYLGKADSPEAQAKYDRAVGEWLAAGRSTPTTCGLAVVELAEKYLAYAKGYYKTPDGKEALSIERVKTAIKGLRQTYGDLPVEQFGPLCLRAMQEKWTGKGTDEDPIRSRKRVNDLVAVVKQMFRWGVAHEIVPVAVWQALLAVDGLKQGRSRAKDSKRVLPVPQSHIDAVKPHVSKQVWALIQLQLVTGARSSEILNLRPCDLNTTDPACWEVRLEKHKTAHRGKTRKLYMGAQAQEIIRPFLDRPLDASLFSPREGNADRKVKARETEDGGRRENQLPTVTKSRRKIGECYTKDSYAKAIRRACIEAKIPHWHPHQLRHNTATALRKHFGIEAAGVILGHSRTNVTELYAEKNEEKAREIVAQLG